MSLTKFHINLHNSKDVFTAGDLISGELIVELTKAKSCRGVKLKFIGQAKVHWSETERRNKHSHTVQYTAAENYFDTVIYVIGSSDGEIELVPGHHVFPFTFPLPINIPDSFEHMYANIRYYIKGIIDRPWKFDHETEYELTVNTPYDISQYHPQRIEDEVNEHFCCCILPCISQGHIEGTIQAPCNAYAIGDPIEVFITIDSQSGSVTVTEITLTFIQTLTFHAQSPEGKTKTDQNTIQKITQGGVLMPGREKKIGMQVPSVIPSGFQHCGIINVSYKLKVGLVVSGCHCDIEKTYDIIIGSISSRASQYRQDQAVGVLLPSAPVDAQTLYHPSKMTKIPLVPVPNIIENPTLAHLAPYPTYPPNAPLGIAGPSIPVPIGFHLHNPGTLESSVPDGLPPSYDAAMAYTAKK